MSGRRAPALTAAVGTVQMQIPAITVTAAPPELVSQRNVEGVAGIPARVYLEMTRAPGFPLRVTHLGKLRLVDRAAFVDHVRALADRPPASPTSGVDALARELGLEPRARRGAAAVSKSTEAT